MLNIIYTDVFKTNVAALSDNQIEEHVSGIIKSFKNNGMHSYEFIICNELMIYAFRAAVKRKKIPHDKICFIFKINNKTSEPFYLDKDAKFIKYPTCYISLFDKYLSELM